jgi:hypothetical protein
LWTSLPWHRSFKVGIGTVFLRRNDDAHALGGGLVKDRVGVIALIRDEVISIYALNQP